jgi:V/A-type H+-transporting ATPase subunit A
VDVSVPHERQKHAFGRVRALVEREYPFSSQEEARSFFTTLTGLLKNLNYSSSESSEYASYRAQIEELVRTLGRPAAEAVMAMDAPPSGGAQTQQQGIRT